MSDVSGGPALISREIEVTTTGEVRVPASFRLNGCEYTVAEILDEWYDHGFGRSVRKGRWWQRRHRTYYRVKTTDGETFEIYQDRGTKLEAPKRWFAYRKL